MSREIPQEKRVLTQGDGQPFFRVSSHARGSLLAGGNRQNKRSLNLFKLEARQTLAGSAMRSGESTATARRAPGPTPCRQTPEASQGVCRGRREPCRGPGPRGIEGSKRREKAPAHSGQAPGRQHGRAGGKHERACAGALEPGARLRGLLSSASARSSRHFGTPAARCAEQRVAALPAARGGAPEPADSSWHARTHPLALCRTFRAAGRCDRKTPKGFLKGGAFRKEARGE